MHCLGNIDTHVAVHEYKLEIYTIRRRNRCLIMFVKFTPIHPDDFIKEMSSLIEIIVQECMMKFVFVNLTREYQSIIEYF